jgi:hypothetical protein
MGCLPSLKGFFHNLIQLCKIFLSGETLHIIVGICNKIKDFLWSLINFFGRVENVLK